MPLLSNPRNELYAQFRAAGHSPTEAAELAGFAPNSAKKNAKRIDSNNGVQSRIAELCTLAQTIPTVSAWLNRNYVLQSLKNVFDRAMEKDKLGDAIRALELIGKELGMFIERRDVTIWDGDVSKLDDRQLATLTKQLEVLAFGEDEARVRDERRKALSLEGPVVELPPVKDENEGAPAPFAGV